MATDTIAGHTVQLDSEGYMADADQWNEDIARELAERNRVGLTDQHWTIIRFCRDHYAAEGEPPGVKRIARGNGLTTRRMYELFPKGPGKLAALIAGLPKPASCV